MKSIKAILFMLLLICCGIISCSTSIDGSYPSRVEAGYIDLTSWDFRNNGSVNLDGQWEFYWNKLLVPKDFKSWSPAVINLDN